MKLIMIYEQENNDKIVLTKERFEELIEQIYQAGYEDAAKTVKHTTPHLFPYPTWVLELDGFANLHNKDTTITFSHDNKRFNL